MSGSSSQKSEKRPGIHKRMGLGYRRFIVFQRLASPFTRNSAPVLINTKQAWIGPHSMIEVEHLTKRFPGPGGEEVTAVEDLSFQVNRGEVYGLLGPNGAGKTTTVRMILGLLPATEGTASIDGYRSANSPQEVKRRVGLVAAGTGVYQGLSAREMLMYFADLYDVPLNEATAELEHLSKLLGLDEFLERRCSVLSTGQKQRLQLARALIHRPPVMLLDEPT
ncbi:MAG: ATP-binding cassette domain-containing protein, partial [Planctomycetaceae bacterium]|nr:ATP-binding cassette domain-containing protein [Planctomycetaceae bacterium]